ncbi:hypothetical protein Ct61P_14521 [Colletotrichum tofieldiae]|nr:hypothetical protein Ct61P_14521 [Colletotrichum tofieldiae]
MPPTLPTKNLETTLHAINALASDTVQPSIALLWNQLQRDFNGAKAIIDACQNKTAAARIDDDDASGDNDGRDEADDTQRQHERLANETFQSWAIKHVDRQILCIATDHANEAHLSEYKSANDGRLSRLRTASKLWGASPGLMCFLFGIEIFPKSRPAVESLRILHRKSHGGQLVKLYAAFRAADKTKPLRGNATRQSLPIECFQQAIESFDPTCWKTSRNYRKHKTRKNSPVNDESDDDGRDTEAYKVNVRHDDNEGEGVQNAATMGSKVSANQNSNVLDDQQYDGSNHNYDGDFGDLGAGAGVDTPSVDEPDRGRAHGAASDEADTHFYRKDGEAIQGAAVQQQDASNANFQSEYENFGTGAGEDLSSDDEFESGRGHDAASSDDLKRGGTVDESLLLPSTLSSNARDFGPSTPPSNDDACSHFSATPKPSTLQDDSFIFHYHSSPVVSRVRSTQPGPSVKPKATTEGQKRRRPSMSDTERFIKIPRLNSSAPLAHGILSPLSSVDTDAHHDISRNKQITKPRPQTWRHLNLRLVIDSSESLLPGVWINDVVMMTLMSRLAGPASAVVDSLLPSADSLSVKTLTRLAENARGKRLVLFPVHEHRHWILYVWRTGPGSLTRYDSLRNSKPTARQLQTDAKVLNLVQTIQAPSNASSLSALTTRLAKSPRVLSLPC